MYKVYISHNSIVVSEVEFETYKEALNYVTENNIVDLFGFSKYSFRIEEDND